jgi:heme oxygenase
MTPERRDELRRADDAVKHARYTLDRKNYIATIEAQEARISALESLLADIGSEAAMIPWMNRSIGLNILIARIDAILPATEVDK